MLIVLLKNNCIIFFIRALKRVLRRAIQEIPNVSLGAILQTGLLEHLPFLAIHADRCSCHKLRPLVEPMLGCSEQSSDLQSQVAYTFQRIKTTDVL